MELGQHLWSKVGGKFVWIEDLFSWW